MIDLLRDPARRAALEDGSRARLEHAWVLLEQALVELRRYGLRDAVERLWNSLGGPATAESPRSLDEAEAFLDVLADAEARDGAVLDLAALADALERLHAPTQPDPDLRIELSTIHKAKGLQFDTVIVPALDRWLRGDERQLLRWSTQLEATHASLVVAPVAESGGKPNALYEWLGAQEKEKLLHERRRLLYVAATRARRWLHLVGSCDVAAGDRGLMLKPPRPTTMLGMLWPLAEVEFAAQLAATDAPPGAAGAEYSREPPLRRFPVGWRPPAPPAGPGLNVHAAPATSATVAVTFDWASQTARHVGTAVHRELQQLCLEGGAGLRRRRGTTSDRSGAHGAGCTGRGASRRRGPRDRRGAIDARGRTRALAPRSVAC